MVTAEQIAKALEVAKLANGSHHDTWVVDQMVRALTGDTYEAWVAEVKSGEDGPETYSWEVGIAP